MFSSPKSFFWVQFAGARLPSSYWANIVIQMVCMACCHVILTFVDFFSGSCFKRRPNTFLILNPLNSCCCVWLCVVTSRVKHPPMDQDVFFKKVVLWGRWYPVLAHKDDNNCLIFATSKLFHWQRIQFNSRRPTSTPFTFFAEWDQGRCLPIIPARLGQFSSSDSTALSDANGPNGYPHQSMQNVHISPQVHHSVTQPTAAFVHVVLWLLAKLMPLHNGLKALADS